MTEDQERKMLALLDRIAVAVEQTAQSVASLNKILRNQTTTQRLAEDAKNRGKLY